MHVRNGFLALFTATAMLVSAAASADGKRHHGHHHSGPRVGVSLNFGAPAYYYGPRYYHPRPYWRQGWYGFGPSWYFYNEIPVVHHYETTRIVEAPAPATSGPPPAQNWYLCPDYDEYYPYVTDCPSGWTVVPATPRKQ